MSNENEEYDTDDKPTPKMDEKSEKIISDISIVLRNFAIVVILFLLMSFIANKYIAGLGMNFIPMFLPVGKSFYKWPVLTSLFHPPLTSEQEKNTKFFKTAKLESGNYSQDYKYYELMNMGGNFFNIIKGLIFNGVVSKKTTIPMVPIYIADYDTMGWQKIIMVIFGAIQVLLGTAMTLFSCFAYLFSGKHTFFFNMPSALKEDELTEQTGGGLINNIKQKAKKMTSSAPATEDLSESLFKEGSNKILLESGFTKFAAFFDFIYFIPVDKLSYGTSYFIEKHSSFPNRFGYFFLISFVLLFVGLIRGSNLGGFFAIFLIFILFGGYVLNPKHNPHPYCNYVSLIEKINYFLPTNKKLSYDQLANKIQEKKSKIESIMKNYTNSSIDAAAKIGYEIPKVQNGGKLKPHLRKKLKEIREYMEENNIQL